MNRTRRQFGGAAAGALLGLAGAPPGTAAHASEGPRRANAFDGDFIWGAATSAFQIEGAAREAGRGESIWDSFVRLPGKIRGGVTAEIASDSYRRTGEDIAAMRYLGLGGYRFSMAWPRIFPNGRGKPNADGLDHYRRFVDALLEAGIEPFCTLYHWDLPQALEDKGGWLNRDTALRFADYAAAVVCHLPDITKYFTLNETVSFTEGGYGNGLNAPGRALGARGTALASHVAMLAHGRAVRAMRAEARGALAVGSAEVAAVYIPVTEDTEHVDAARRATIIGNAPYVTAVQTGAYPEAYLESLGADVPEIRSGDMEIVGTPTDMQGLNIYYGQTVRAADNRAGFAVVPRPASYPRMQMGWATIDPEAIYWGTRLCAEAFGTRAIYITENGAACADAASDDGKIYDTDRVMFLRAYLGQLQRAVADGVPVKGYFHWTLIDNFEWLEGYEKRFGLFHVDYATQRRTPKLSADVYRAIIANRGL
ncbi:MAG: GH1 family beta-glucosidase [Sphingopyxis sp.]|nr:GH1 family beta-glucosidase [Sphingopyxis sp.]